MDELVLGVVVREFRQSWDSIIAQEDLINLLYDSVSIPANVYNRNGEKISVTKSTASKIVNRTEGGNPNEAIRKHAFDKAVSDSIVSYFDKQVVKRISKGDIDNLIHRLKLIINDDANLSDNVKADLNQRADSKMLSEFLSEVFRQSLLRDNVIPKKKRIPDDEKEKLCQLPLPFDVPEHVEGRETGYTEALLEVYAEAEDLSQMTLDELDDPKYKMHKSNFSRQRQAYFATDAIRRGFRDVFNDGEENQFNVFLDEVYNGVIDVWENKEQFENGYDRLHKVLDRAADVQVNQCWISKETSWIGNQQKKGACHFLVNDGRIEGWVLK